MNNIPDEALEEVSGGEAIPYAKQMYYRVIGSSRATVRVDRYDDHGEVIYPAIEVGTVVVSYHNFQATVGNHTLYCVTRENSSKTFWMRSTDLQNIVPW